MMYPVLRDLAEQARATWPQIDPARLERAVELVEASSTNVQQAHYDEDGGRITPSLEVLIVRGSHGWYVVRKHSCTCPDHRSGHVCKHRLAAWLYTTFISRTYYTRSREQNLQELGF